MRSYIFIVLFLIENVSFSQQKVKSIKLREICSIGNSDQSLFIQVGDITCDDKGFIYVTDQYQYKVKKFDYKGKFISEVGSRGKQRGQFQAGPANIKCITDTVAIVDLGTSNVLFFAADFNLLSKIDVSCPIADIAFDKGGRLYASMIPFGDKESVIRLFDRSGNIVLHIPLYKTSRDPFLNITMLCVDANDYLIVGYLYINKIIVYTDKHEFLTQFKIKELPDQSIANELNSSKIGSFPEGEMFRDIAADKKGYIYVLGGFYSKHPNRDVYVTNYNGDLQTTFILPDESGTLYFDTKGFLYTREQKRTVVKKYAVQYYNF